MESYALLTPRLMQIDFSTLGAYQRYKLMTSLILPWPIALVTTRTADGVVNAAPFNMFNMRGEDPPILMISFNKLQDHHLKDTSADILANRQSRLRWLSRANCRKHWKLPAGISLSARCCDCMRAVGGPAVWLEQGR
ncbi:MAG: hypothetical protein H7274_07530 [Rhodoferax sp.]|nr:hypothetical protein [Rhodoferax sp.]